MEQDVFRLHYEATQARVEEALRERVGQMGRYADLREAMEYSLMAGGKRSGRCWYWRAAVCAAVIRRLPCPLPARWR